MAILKKAQNGRAVPKPKKNVQRTASGIISESGDLADALNAYERDKKLGRVPKTDAEAKKYMDNLYKKGKLGYKMGGKVKKAQMGANLGKVKYQMEDFKKYDDAKKSPLSTGYMVPTSSSSPKKGPSKGRNPKFPKESSSPGVLKKGGTIKKKK